MFTVVKRHLTPGGDDFISFSVHAHGLGFQWPAEAWSLPERDPGDLYVHSDAPKGTPNRVVSRLDILAPDATSVRDVNVSLDMLWLEFATSGEQASDVFGVLPNPVIHEVGEVTLRFQVDPATLPARALELARLRAEATSVLYAWELRAPLRLKSA